MKLGGTEKAAGGKSCRRFRVDTLRAAFEKELISGQAVSGIVLPLYGYVWVALV